MYNDYELVSLAQENNEDAINILHDKYKDLIYVKAKKAYSYLKKKGMDLADIVQEATIGFEEAIKDFDQNDNAIFYTFANICIDRQIKTIILKNNRDKHKILNEALTLDYDDDNSLINLLTDRVTPETKLVSFEDVNELYNNIKRNLTGLEDSVFELKLQGFEYKEISEILGISSKDAYNAIDRIKAKINKIIKK